MSEREDSIERLLEDLDRAAEAAKSWEDRKISEAYFSGDSVENTHTYMGDVAANVSRRLHALMPHDMNGREIKAGDRITFGGEGLGVCGLKVLPVNLEGSVLTSMPEHKVTVVEPDSWERLEEDTKLTPRDYLGGHGIETNEYGRVSSMAADIVRRAKRLAGIREGE